MDNTIFSENMKFHASLQNEGVENDEKYLISCQGDTVIEVFSDGIIEIHNHQVLSKAWHELTQLVGECERQFEYNR